MKKLTLLLCLVALAIASYGQAQRKYELPAPEEAKEEAKEAGSWGGLLKTAVRAATATLGVTKEKVSSQEVSNALHAFEHSADGAWMKDARNLLGKTKEAVQLYMVNDEGAYLYDPSSRSLNLVAEGDFRAQLIEENKKYEGSKVLLLAGQTLGRLLRNSLRGARPSSLAKRKRVTVMQKKQRRARLVTPRLSSPVRSLFS